MSNSIWKMPDQKPDMFKPQTIMVAYEAHDEAELILSTQYEAYAADRYINRWCYLDELLAQADKAERLQKAVDNYEKVIVGAMFAPDVGAVTAGMLEESHKTIKKLIKGNNQ